MLFDQDMQKLLHQNGWSESREIEIISVVKELEKDGFACNSQAEDILSSFMNLEIKPIRRDLDGSVTNVLFDPMFSCGLGHLLEDWERNLSESLFPIGVVFNAMSLLCSNSGTIYAGYENEIWHIDDTINDAFRVLLYGEKDLKEV